MHQRAALHAGEHRRIELLRQLLVVGEDRAAARAAQRLVRGRRHDMRMRERARMRAAGHEAGEMRHVDHEIGADLVGDLAEAAEIDDARIGRAAGDDDFRLVLLGEPLDLVHVDEVVVAAHAIGHDLEPVAGHVDRRAVGEMAAGGEVEPHEGVARLHQRHEHFGIGRGAGMRLHIGKRAAEQFGHALDRQPLGDIDELAAAVIALARQAFGIFVGQHRALRLEHGAADDVLRRDQLDLVALAAKLAARWPRRFRGRSRRAWRRRSPRPPAWRCGDRHACLLDRQNALCCRLIHRPPASMPAEQPQGLGYFGG